MNDIKDYFSKYIETKNKLKELEKKADKYNKIIQDYMTKENINSFEHDHEDKTYKFKKSIVARESISKKELPSEIWDKYCKSTSYVMISMKEIKEMKK
jgi:hypothetical protein